jgi:hypothetical protein
LRSGKLIDASLDLLGVAVEINRLAHEHSGSRA